MNIVFAYQNAAALEAKEDILVNVDGDNLIGAGLDAVVMAVSIHLVTKFNVGNPC